MAVVTICSDFGLWLLILCVKLIGLRDTQRAGKILFLDVFVGYFGKRLAFDSVDWVKTFLHPCRQAWSSPLGASVEQKRKSEFRLPSWSKTHKKYFFPWFYSSELLVLEHLDSNGIIPSGSLVLQFTESRSLDFLVSITSQTTVI